MNKLNDIVLINQWVKEKIKREIKIIFETNENGNKMYPNLWNVAKTVVRQKFIAINTNIQQEEISQIRNLKLYILELKIGNKLGL